MIKLSTGTTTGLQKITPEQKIGLAVQWITIASEYPAIIEQAVLSGVKTTAEYRAYEASYGALDAYLHTADSGILVHMDALSFVEPAEYQKVWNAYYSDKAKLLLLVAVPPTNQVTDITLSAIPQADKTINVTVACKYTQSFFKATHIVLYRTSATSAPRPIDTASAHAHVIPLLPNAPDNHEYTTTINLPQVSGNIQLHYRFAISAAFLGAGALALHKDGIIDGGVDWHDVTVEQLIADLFCELVALDDLSAIGNAQQVGLYQGQLYRWAGRWVLQQAKKPLDPVCLYDMVDMPGPYGKVLKQWKNIPSGSDYRIFSTVLNDYKGKTLFVIFDSEKLTAEGLNYPELTGYTAGWTHIFLALDSRIQKRHVAMVSVPCATVDVNLDVYNVHTKLRNGTDCATCLSVIHELTLREPNYVAQLIDSSANGNHLIAGGVVEKIKDSKVGIALAFDKGYLCPGENFTPSVSDYSVDIPAANDNYNYKPIGFLTTCRYGYTYTVEANFTVISGQPQKATFFYYDFTSGKILAESHTPVVDNRCRAFLTFTHNPPAGHFVQLLVYAGEAGQTANVAAKYTNFSLVQHSALPYVGIGKQWTQSRWIKLSALQEISTSIYLWRYGNFDYCMFNTLPDGSVEGSVYIKTHKDAVAAVNIEIPTTALLTNEWQHLVVMTDLQDTYCRKIVYLNGKKIKDTRVDAAFNGMTYGVLDFCDMAKAPDKNCVKGFLANMIAYDRFLTEQEILYLYCNPRYSARSES